MEHALTPPATEASAESATLVDFLTKLPDDLLSHILCLLPLAHDIARTAKTSRRLKRAADLAFAARPFSPEVLTLSASHGHTRVLNCVAAANDGHVLTGSEDKTVKVWHGDELVRTIQAHRSWVTAMAVLPGGARFVSGSLDGTAKLFTFGGELKRTFEVGSSVRCVAALPDGAHFVVGLGQGPNKGEVRLYNVDGTLVHAFTGHTHAVMAVAVTADGQHIISGALYLVKVWSVATESLVSTCRGNTQAVAVVAAMPDGQLILSGSNDKTVRVWLLNGTLQNTFRLHTDKVLALAALPDNKHALSGSWDTTIKLFNVNNGAVLRTFNHHSKGVYSLALLSDGRRFVSGPWETSAHIAYHGLWVK